MGEDEQGRLVYWEFERPLRALLENGCSDYDQCGDAICRYCNQLLEKGHGPKCEFAAANRLIETTDRIRAERGIPNPYLTPRDEA